MTNKPIKTEESYELALQRVDSLMDAKPDTPEGDELAMLVTLIEAYEAKQYPINAPKPIETLRFRMEQCRFRNKI